MSRDRRRAARAGARLPRAPAALPAARVGRARPGGDLGERRSRPPRMLVRDARRRCVGLGAIGITNQRETTLLWERATGRPVAPGDRLAGPAYGGALPRAAGRPDPRADRARARPVLLGDEARVAARAHGAPAGRARVRHGRLVARLEADRRRASTRPTRRTRRARCSSTSTRWTGTTSCSSCSASTAALLPRLVGSSEVIGEAEFLGATLPVAAIAGDQQAALFGQGCFAPGEAKATYGTGSFVLVNVGDATAACAARACSATVAASRRVRVALEGAILVSGAAIQWLRDGLGVLADAAESEAARARGRLDRRRLLRPRAHGARLAALGSRRARTDHRPDARHDAGAPRARRARGDRVPGRRRPRRAPGRRQRAARRRRRERERVPDAVPVRPARRARSRSPPSAETTALGAAALAGLAIGVWPDPAAVRELIGAGATYDPSADRETAFARRQEWRQALRRALLH